MIYFVRLVNVFAIFSYHLYYSITRNYESSFLISFAWFVISFAIPILFIYIYITKILKMPLNSFRIRKPKSITIWILCAAALPLFISGFYILLTPGSFTALDLNSKLAKQQIQEAVLSDYLVAGIIEEIIFRGFIMHLLEIRWNKHIAIIVPPVLIELAYINCLYLPTTTDDLMYIVVGAAAGIMLSLIAYQSDSIWPGAIVHGVWNLFIHGGILSISAYHSSSLFTYTLYSESTLLTGGTLGGIAHALPAFIAYSIIIILAWRMQKSKSVTNLQTTANG